MDQHVFNLLALLCFVTTGVIARHSPRRVYKTNEGKIVGGTETTIQNHPYQVYLVLKQAGLEDYYECGGSIATQRCILTAAHCITGKESVVIRVGSTNTTSGGTTYNSRMLFMHPFYNATIFDYDIAVIKLWRRITIDGTNSSLADLPTSNCSVPVGTNLTVTGWGDTTENGQHSSVLRAVTIKAVSSDKCKETYSYLTPRMTCAGVPEGEKDACQGDSGGALAKTGTKSQVGIVSHGFGCGRPNVPGVYTNLCNPDIQNWLRLMRCL